jgi:hypothetical protein
MTNKKETSRDVTEILRGIEQLSAKARALDLQTLSFFAGHGEARNNPPDRSGRTRRPMTRETIAQSRRNGNGLTHYATLER